MDFGTIAASNIQHVIQLVLRPAIWFEGCTCDHKLFFFGRGAIALHGLMHFRARERGRERERKREREREKEKERGRGKRRGKRRGRARKSEQEREREGEREGEREAESEGESEGERERESLGESVLVSFCLRYSKCQKFFSRLQNLWKVQACCHDNIFA